MTAPTSFSLFSCAPLSQPTLTPRQNEFLEELLAFEIFRIQGEGHALGQRIFEELKADLGDSSEAGLALTEIWEALLFSPTRKAVERKDLFEKIWAGIGDDTWQWPEL